MGNEQEFARDQSQLRQEIQLTTQALVNNRTESSSRIHFFMSFPRVVITTSVDKRRLHRLTAKAKPNFVSVHRNGTMFPLEVNNRRQLAGDRDRPFGIKGRVGEASFVSWWQPY